MKVFLGVLLVILLFAVNVLLMPYLLFLVLGALGFDITFLVCVGIWVLVTAVFSLMR